MGIWVDSSNIDTTAIPNEVKLTGGADDLTVVAAYWYPFAGWVNIDYTVYGEGKTLNLNNKTLRMINTPDSRIITPFGFETIINGKIIIDNSGDPVNENRSFFDTTCPNPNSDGTVETSACDDPYDLILNNVTIEFESALVSSDIDNSCDIETPCIIGINVGKNLEIFASNIIFKDIINATGIKFLGNFAMYGQSNINMGNIIGNNTNGDRASIGIMCHINDSLSIQPLTPKYGDLTEFYINGFGNILITDECSINTGEINKGALIYNSTQVQVIYPNINYSITSYYKLVINGISNCYFDNSVINTGNITSGSLIGVGMIETHPGSVIRITNLYDSASSEEINLINGKQLKDKFKCKCVVSFD